MKSALPFVESERFYTVNLPVATAGTLVLTLHLPRPLRLWLDGLLALDLPLSWRRFERDIRAAVLFPAAGHPIEMRLEIGPRPRHPEHIDRDCPSRNRQHCLAGVAKRLPDQLTYTASVVPGIAAPPVGLQFLPSQFVRDATFWQHLLAQWIRGAGEPPSTMLWSPADDPWPALALRTTVTPRHGIEMTSDAERAAGYRRFAVPVAAPGDEPPPQRDLGPDQRVEPYRDVARELELTVAGTTGAVTVPMPAFESVGRQAPPREYRPVVWPVGDGWKPHVPQPVWPARWARFGCAYEAAWQMLARLGRSARPHSGLPNDYISTGSNFAFFQFVWDTSLTALCTAYGWRTFDPCASLNLFYATQFDGGYIHRELDVRDATAVLYEPDFSPNPPLLSVAEWQIARLTGNLQRLRQVYACLTGYHRWLQHNRRLPDGTYWTSGLANGLDNSPSLGNGYPDLTAQMAHDAETLALIAGALGRVDDADEFRRERDAIGAALNERLWDARQEIYATSLPGGGHNPHKVVTAFWPLWAGLVPPERVAALARHLKDPASFWRHHPLPSLAADSPHFKPEGQYWLGSTWPPTNYVAIKGFYRAGRHDLARETAARHLACVTDVLEQTGALWENYSSEASRPGNVSAPDYCWAALGPIALVLEVLIGLEADALHDTIRWQPPADLTIGVERFPLGPATISLLQRDGQLTIQTDRSFRLEFVRGAVTRVVDCRIGQTTVSLG